MVVLFFSSRIFSYMATTVVHKHRWKLIVFTDQLINDALTLITVVFLLNIGKIKVDNLLFSINKNLLQFNQNTWRIVQNIRPVELSQNNLKLRTGVKDKICFIWRLKTLLINTNASIRCQINYAPDQNKNSQISTEAHFKVFFNPTYLAIFLYIKIL